MKKLISSHYNKQKGISSFLFDLKKTNIEKLLMSIEIFDCIMCFDNLNFANDVADFCNPKIKNDNLFIYMTKKDNFGKIAQVLIGKNDINVTLLEMFDNNCKKKYLDNPSLFNENILEYKIAKCIVEISQFESEIRVFYTNISLENFEKIKNKLGSI